MSSPQYTAPLLVPVLPESGSANPSLTLTTLMQLSPLQVPFPHPIPSHNKPAMDLGSEIALVCVPALPLICHCDLKQIT